MKIIVDSLSKVGKFILQQIMEIKNVPKSNFERHFQTGLQTLIVALVTFTFTRLDKLNESMVRVDERLKVSQEQYFDLKNDVNKLKMDVININQQLTEIKFSTINQNNNGK